MNCATATASAHRIRTCANNQQAKLLFLRHRHCHIYIHIVYNIHIHTYIYNTQSLPGSCPKTLSIFVALRHKTLSNSPRKCSFEMKRKSLRKRILSAKASKNKTDRHTTHILAVVYACRCVCVCVLWQHKDQISFVPVKRGNCIATLQA